MKCSNMASNLQITLVLLFLLYYKGSSGLLAPSFISNWHWMDLSNTATLSPVFTHSFGEFPAYCDVQIQSPDTGFIYPGRGSGMMDDDEGVRGGVMFFYSTSQIKLLAPIYTDDEAIEYIILTGIFSYVSNDRETVSAANVRARCWKTSDFPPSSHDIEFSISNGDSVTTTHPLGVVPVWTTVQLFIGSAPNIWISQSEGSYADNNNAENYGGSYFGVDANNIKLWTLPNSVFSKCDGWSSDSTFGDTCFLTSASVFIRMWACLESPTLFSQSVSHSLSSDSTSHQVSITSPFNQDTDLVIVRAQVTTGTGNIVGYYFLGLGSALTDSNTEHSTPSYYQTGGFVYASNNVTGAVRLWHPTDYSSCTSCRCIVKTSGSCASAVNIHIAIVQGLASFDLTLPAHVHLMSRSTCFRSFSCTSPYIHKLGNLSQTHVDGAWQGTLPTCVYCDSVEGGINAILNITAPATVNAYATYTCKDGYSLVNGSLSRQCVEVSSDVYEWLEPEPVCELISTNPPTTTTTTTTAAPTTTSGTTTAPTTAYVCYNYTIVSSPEVLEEATKAAEEISKNLTVDTKTTGAFMRSLTSAKDERQSAFFVGMVGYLVFGIVFGLMILLDLLTVVKHCTEN